ncbi:hypothetical protein BpHYR1_043786 [Brachionus plicatilis]|uniref:Uncharacterized protein n=1 Tax=Brachionus plicatilis TaxID=10195 RepID=A0A3M7PDN7_BRAPC|nr:hypothetical protein BpHYR1_043786 [Brachionus plicatilis]
MALSFSQYFKAIRNSSYTQSVARATTLTTNETTTLNTIASSTETATATSMLNPSLNYLSNCRVRFATTLIASTLFLFLCELIYGFENKLSA